MICMPNSFVLWAPKELSEITVESLRLLELVIPKIGDYFFANWLFKQQEDSPCYGSV